MPEKKKQNKKQSSRAGGSRRGKQPKRSRAPRERKLKLPFALSVYERSKHRDMAAYAAVLASPLAPPVGIPYGFPVASVCYRVTSRQSVVTSTTLHTVIGFNLSRVSDYEFSRIGTLANTSSTTIDSVPGASDLLPLPYNGASMGTTYPTLRARVVAVHHKAMNISAPLYKSGVAWSFIAPDNSDVGDMTAGMIVSRPWATMYNASIEDNDPALVFVAKTESEFTWTQDHTTGGEYGGFLFGPTTAVNSWVIETTAYVEYSGGPVSGAMSCPHNAALNRLHSTTLNETSAGGAAANLAASAYSYIQTNYPDALNTFVQAAGRAVLNAMTRHGVRTMNRLEL